MSPTGRQVVFSRTQRNATGLVFGHVTQRKAKFSSCFASGIKESKGVASQPEPQSVSLSLPVDHESEEKKAAANVVGVRSMIFVFFAI